MPKLAALLLVLPLAACGFGSGGPEGPPPGSVGEQEMQEAMPETKLFEENPPGDAAGAP